MVIYQNKYTIGGNEPTGGIEDGWFVYSHGSYYGEVPDEYLTNDDGRFIDGKGNVVSQENKVVNEYYNEFNKKWLPTEKKPNPSLPKVIYYKEK